MSYFSKFISALVCAAALVSYAPNALASGFMLNEYSVTAQGRSFAGVGLVGDDISAIADNPAAIMLMNETVRVQAGATFIQLGATFNGGVKSLSNSITGYDASGKAFANIHGIVPNFYAVYKPHERVRVGLGVFAPFGLVTEYDENSILKPFAIKSDLQIIEIAPSVAVRIIGGLSIGVTANIQYGSAHLTQKSPAVNAALGGHVGELYADIKGSDWAVGGTVGLMYDFGETPLGTATRIGLNYRSTVAHDLKGSMKTEFTSNGAAVPPAALSALNSSRDVSAAVDLPNVVMLSVYQQLKAPVGISFTAKYIQWSLFKELNIKDSGTAPVKENWKDTFSFHLGADWFVNKYWTIRGGIAYDMTPVKSAEYLTARLPDNDRYLLSLGMSFMPHKNWIFDVAYTHVFMPNRATNNTHIPFNQNGKYEFLKTGHIIGIQAQFKY